MSELKEFLINISEEKKEKIIPQNIKKGVKIFDIEGELEAGIDTSDANVIPSKMAMGYSGYVNGQKIEGDAFDVGKGLMDYSVYDISLDDEEQRVRLTLKMAMDYVVNAGGGFVAIPRYSDLAEKIGLTADKLVEGNTIIGVEGTAKLGVDTSNATATAEDIIVGKTAYVNGEKLTGTLDRSYGSSTIVYSDNIEVAEGLTLRFNHTFKEACAFQKGSYFNLQADIDSLRSAIGLTADKIKKGETILGVTGTYTGEESAGSEHNGGTN